MDGIMKSYSIKVKKIIQYIIQTVIMALLSCGLAVLGMAGQYFIELSGEPNVITGYLYLILIFVMMFSLPIIGIVGIYKHKFLRKNMWMFIPVSILDAIFSYLLTDWLTINLLVHGSEYSWWGFQLLWFGRILVVNVSVILITLLICLIKRYGKKAEDKKAAKGEEI